MSESVTRGFREKYKAMIGEAAVYDFMHFRRQNIKRGAAALKRESSSGVDTDKTKPFKNGMLLFLNIFIVIIYVY